MTAARSRGKKSEEKGTQEARSIRLNEPELSPQEKARQNNQVALAILQMRRRAGLTQKQLALRIGTHQSVISDLESADYTGYSLEMLERIARALNMRLDLTFTPEDEGK